MAVFKAVIRGGFDPDAPPLIYPTIERAAIGIDAPPVIGLLFNSAPRRYPDTPPKTKNGGRRAS